jgi:hypothetical protein
MRRSSALSLLAGLVLVLGCARAVEVGSAAPSYPIRVQNSAAADLIVSYDDGSGPRTLGTVQAGRTERYIIASPGRLTITVQGRSADGGVTSGPHTVELRTGDPPTVVLR